MLHVGPGGPTPQQMSPISHGGIKKVTAAATLAVYEQVVDVVVDGANYNITLPPVSAARGRIVSFQADVKTAHAATVVDAGDASVSTSVALGTDNEGLVLYSDGRRWHTLANA